jgi:hypothetical protein
METGKTAPAFARLRRDQPDKRIPNPKARLQEQVREVMRFHHYLAYADLRRHMKNR